MEVQLQVYIISGVLLALGVCCLFLVFYVFKLRRMIVANTKRTSVGNYAYTNPTILPNEELAQRGFQQFSGHSGSGVIITDTMMQNTNSSLSNQQFDIKWNNSRDPGTQNNNDNVFDQHQGNNNDVNNIHEARTYFQD